MFESLLPAEVRVAGGGPEPEHTLLADEARSIAGAAPGRLREFAGGRACARAALKRLPGVPAGPLPRDPDGAVVWPPGVTGSITHCGQRCFAAVAYSRQVPALGIDLERIRPLEPGAVALIATDREYRDWRAAAPETRDALAIRLFSAKESLYKCCHPLVRRFIDFREVEIDWDDAAFAPRWLAPDLQTALTGRVVHGRWRSDGHYLWTAAFCTP